MLKHCCEVFADVNAIYFTTLWWIMNDWDWFKILKTQLFGKCIWILFFLWKWIKYTFVLFVLKICLELGVLQWNQLELLYTLRKKIGAGPPVHNFFIIHPRIFFLNQNVEFDLSIGHALVLFPIFGIINKKCTVDHVRPSPSPPKFIYINIFWT